MEASPSTELAELVQLKAELQAEAGSLASLAAELVSTTTPAGMGQMVTPASAIVPVAATPAPAGGGQSYSQLLDSNGNRWPELDLDLGLGRAGGAGGVLPRPAAFPDIAGAVPCGPVDVLPQLSPGCGHGIGMAKATVTQGSKQLATCSATLDQLRDITALKDKVIARLGDKLRAHEASVGEVVDALKRDLEAERSAHQHSKLELRDALQQLHAAIRTSNAAQAELKQEKELYRETLQTINNRCEQRDKFYVGLEKRCEALTAQEQTRSAQAESQTKALVDQKAKNKALTHSLGLQKEENMLQLQQTRFYEASVQQFTPTDVAGSGGSHHPSA